jgi:hypothetical protein
LTRITSYTPYLVIARLVTLGWVLPIDVIVKFETFINKFKSGVVSPETKLTPKAPPKKVEETYEHLTNIDLYVDSKLYDTNYTYTVETQVLKIKACIDYIDKLLLQITEDYSFKGYDKVSYNKLKTNLESLKEEYLKAKVSSKPTTRKINKNVMIKSVKYSVKKIGTCEKLYTPINIIGKKKLYVYDESKGLLLCFLSQTGFTFSGTTLKGFTDKSVSTRIKDIAILSQSLTSLNEILTTAKLVKPVPSGRFNDSMVILAIS